jgi:predicted RNA-binding Zn-ribbon protein involved in translation (DUF1610 family)
MPKHTDGTARKFRRQSVLLDSLSSRDLANTSELLIGCTKMELKVQCDSMLISSYPSPTEIIARCPQCRAITNISIIEPDLESRKEWHTFVCEECGMARRYLIDRETPAAWRDSSRERNFRH